MTTKKHEDRELFLEYGVHFPTRTLTMVEDFTQDSACRAIKALHLLDAEDDSPITIKLSSTGGEEYAGFAVYSAIRQCRSRVVIEASGAIQSMAVFVLQAGDERIATDPFTQFMVHEGWQGYGRDISRTELRAFSKQADETDAIYNNILMDRILEKNPEFTIENLEQMIKDNKFFNVTTALSLGLIDEVMA